MELIRIGSRMRGDAISLFYRLRDDIEKKTWISSKLFRIRPKSIGVKCSLYSMLSYLNTASRNNYFEFFKISGFYHWSIWLSFYSHACATRYTWPIRSTRKISLRLYSNTLFTLFCSEKLCNLYEILYRLTSQRSL